MKSAREWVAQQGIRSIIAREPDLIAFVHDIQRDVRAEMRGRVPNPELWLATERQERKVQKLKARVKARAAKIASPSARPSGATGWDALE